MKSQKCDRTHVELPTYPAMGIRSNVVRMQAIRTTDAFEMMSDPKILKWTDPNKNLKRDWPEPEISNGTDQNKKFKMRLARTII